MGLTKFSIQCMIFQVDKGVLTDRIRAPFFYKGVLSALRRFISVGKESKMASTRDGRV